MSDTSTSRPEPPADDSSLDSATALESAVFDQETDAEEQPREWSGPVCDKCNAPLASDVVSICRSCGWYASLNAFVEIDPDWEIETSPATNKTAASAQPLKLTDWLKMVPRSAWIIVASLLLVTVESLVARFATPSGSTYRTAWSIAQLFAGLFLAIGCHIFNFLVLAADDADIGVLDLALKPIKLWTRAVHNLPTRLWVVNSAACGTWAAVLSVVVIGALPYDRLWDWGFKEAPKQNLMGAVMDRVKQLDSGKGSDDLEKSVNDFAGNADAEAKANHKPQPPKPIEKADCVILGYLQNRDGRISTLFLGTAEGGRLVYAGSVTPKLSEDEQQSLAEMFKQIEIARPIVRIDANGTWIQPKITCRVTYGQRTKAGHLRDIEWDKMLGRIDKR